MTTDSLDNPIEIVDPGDATGIVTFNVKDVYSAKGVPYTHVSAIVQEGHGVHLELAGMLAFDHDGDILGGDTYHQTMNILGKIAHVICISAKHFSNSNYRPASIGESMDSIDRSINGIVKTRVDLLDPDGWTPEGIAGVNRAYQKHNLLKPRTMVGVSRLPLQASGALVEITASAFLKYGTF